MGDPYVNSGESFIRTTGRVSVNVALYDMILTTRHLILVDNTYARFEPQMIPVLTILSVTAGKVATGEPVITLTFTATGSTGGPAQMNLIFSQQPGEQRKRERDEWIKLLIDHIVAARHQDIHADAAPAHAKRDRLPPGATPRPIEPAFPRKTSSGQDSFSPEIVILPDEVESPAGEEEAKVSSPAVTPQGPATEGRSSSADAGTKSPATTMPASPPDKGLPGSAGEKSGTADTDPSAVMTKKGPAGSVIKTTLLPAASTLPGPSGKEPQAAQGGDRGPQNSFALTLQAAIQSLVAPKGTTGSPHGETSPAVAPEESTPASKEERASLGAPAVLPREEPKDQPAEETTPPASASSPPLQKPWSRQNTVLAVSILVIIILAVVGGMILNVPVGPQKGNEPLVPVVTTAPTLPATPAPVTIPGNGVWVRVEYNGSFIGDVGNPGSLQHVGGSGDRFYYIPKSDDLVQASIQKQDNSGSTLTIEVYRNGEMVLHRTTRAPKGQVQILIDPRTGKPPVSQPQP